MYIKNIICIMGTSLTLNLGVPYAMAEISPYDKIDPGINTISITSESLSSRISDNEEKIAENTSNLEDLSEKVSQNTVNIALLGGTSDTTDETSNTASSGNSGSSSASTSWNTIYDGSVTIKATQSHVFTIPTKTTSVKFTFYNYESSNAKSITISSSDADTNYFLGEWEDTNSLTDDWPEYDANAVFSPSNGTLTVKVTTDIGDSHGGSIKIADVKAKY